MRVQVIGGGGREHSIVWALKQSPQVKKIIGAPKNVGIAQIPNAECFDVAADDIDGQVALATKHKSDLVLIGPEIPLADGMADRFRAEDIPVVGPSQRAAQIESSKIFCKKLLFKYGIPSADFNVFYQVELARQYIYSLEGHDYPVAIKANGLAAGKGVIIAQNQRAAIRAINDMMARDKFGEAGKKIIIEKFLTGRECSIIVAVDANGNIVVFPPSRDYKPARDNNEGPNTGGMGAYSPLPDVTPIMLEKIRQTIIEPTLAGLANEGCAYQGILYAGLMITDKGPKVLEYNCRFGDPETQVVLPLLKSDFAEMMMATATGQLANYNAEWYDLRTVCVVLASRGYPGKYKTGFTITGLDIAKDDNILIFHAGTGPGPTTKGGRVLNVVGLGGNQKQAQQRAYTAVDLIDFNGKQYRKDIAT